MRKIFVLFTFVIPLAALAAQSAIDRWADALGGHDKLAAIKAIYREGTLIYGGREGTIKVWHTAEGKYRKEEQVGTFTSVETFDGTTGFIQQGDTPPRQLAAEELGIARSKAFANSNAIFFVFFPERHRGTRSATDDTIIFKPDGGVEWRIVLDPQSSLPKTMIHEEGGRTITVTFEAYEKVDGLQLEKEIHRSAGNPATGATIRFSRTELNPTLDPTLFFPSFGKGATNARAQATELVSRLQRADYDGDRTALERCYDALAPFLQDQGLACRIHYWRGFALWRSAINGYNDKVEPAELEQLFLHGADEFKESLRLEPAFSEAKVGIVSCLGYVAYTHRKQPERIQQLLAQISPLVRELKTTAPNNPRFIWVLGPIIWYTPADRGGGPDKVLENYERGLESCATQAPSRDPLEPSWGKPELLMSAAYSYLRKTPPDLHRAESYARSALELVPHWRYLRDILLPQIIEAQTKQACMSGL